MSFDDGAAADDAPSYISYEDGLAVEPDPPPKRSGPRSNAGSPLVSFDDAEASVGADALVTLDRAGVDLGDALSDGPIDEPSEEIEFAGDEDAFDDEAATMVKSSDSLYGGGQGSQGRSGRPASANLGASSDADQRSPVPPSG